MIKSASVFYRHQLPDVLKGDRLEYLCFGPRSVPFSDQRLPSRWLSYFTKQLFPDNHLAHMELIEDFLNFITKNNSTGEPTVEILLRLYPEYKSHIHKALLIVCKQKLSC